MRGIRQLRYGKRIEIGRTTDSHYIARNASETRTLSAVSFEGKGRFPFCGMYKAALTRPRFIEHAVAFPREHCHYGLFCGFSV